MTKALAQVESVSLASGKFKSGPLGLEVEGQPTFEEWEVVGKQLRAIEGAVLWWWGDWLNYGERAYGEKYSQALDASDYAYQTLRDAVWVSERVELSRRRDNLTWSHHREVAALEPPEQDRLLDAAIENSWTRQELRAAVKGRHKKVPTEPAQGEYSVIVVDPPWPYEAREKDESHRARSQYQQMTVEEITALAVPAAPDCILWLWTTNAFMHEAYHIVEAWGFQVKTILTWEKKQMGLGDWLRGKTEHCLMCVKGSPVVNLTNETTALVADRREHSRKPVEFFTMVETLCPGNRLEMFAREKREGWDSWGDEIDKFPGD